MHYQCGHTFGNFRLLSSHREFFNFGLCYILPMNDEDLIPRSKSPIAHPETESVRQYAWLDCRIKGWQVLSSVPNESSSIPEPPKCVQNPRTKSKSGSPRRGVRDKVPTGTLLMDSSVSPDTSLMNGGEPVSPLPEKNFILANIRNTSPQKRHTRTALLEKACNQLRESEMVSASLAERLNIIQNRLSNQQDVEIVPAAVTVL